MAMSNLEIIEHQHAIIHAQNDIIRAQAQALAQFGALVMEEERAAAWAKYDALLGGASRTETQLGGSETDVY